MSKRMANEKMAEEAKKIIDHENIENSRSLNKNEIKELVIERQ